MLPGVTGTPSSMARQVAMRTLDCAGLNAGGSPKRAYASTSASTDGLELALLVVAMPCLLVRDGSARAASTTSVSLLETPSIRVTTQLGHARGPPEDTGMAGNA